MKKLQYVFLSLLCLWTGIVANAQSDGLTVKRFEDVSTVKQYARTQPKYDNNGEYAALVLVQVLTDAHIDFTASYLLGEVEKKASEYWVYMAAGAKSLEVHCAGYEKIKVTFAEASNGEINSLVKQCTYELVIAAPAKQVIIVRDTVVIKERALGVSNSQSYPFNLFVEPAHAKVEVIANGVQSKWVLENGVADLKLQEGEYRYRITAENYHTAQGTIHIPTSSSETVKLRPTFGWITVANDSMDLEGVSLEVLGKGQRDVLTLPLDHKAYQHGVYTVNITKPKHHSYRREVRVEEGQEIRLCPVLEPKVYKTNTLLLAEAGLAINPSWSAGLMIGQIYGEARSACGVGWYIKGRSNFSFQKNDSGMACDKDGRVNGQLMFYNGKKTSSMWMVNAGLLLNFLHKSQIESKNNIFGLYMGAGYGSYHRLWQMTDERWVGYAPTAVQSFSAAAGLMGSIKGATLMAGVNTIGFKYMELEVGLGWTF